MSAIGHAPPPFFNRGPAPLVRLFFFVSISIILLIADLRFHTLEWTRLTMATIVWPIQRAAWLPIQAAGNIGRYFIRQSALQTENEYLQQQRMKAAKLLLRQRHLEDENQRLRALLDMRMRQPVNGQIAEIIYAARDPFSRHVIIDKGLQQGIQAGQVVVDERGVIGQVVRSFPRTAEVSLLTDKQQAIPVQVQRNGLRSILSGTGNGRLELRFLASDADVQVGDILVTSGLDGIYLAGLPVAKVIRINHDNAYVFARIFCDPIAGIEHHGLVLVLESRTPLALPQTEVPAPEKSKLGRKEKE
ncbi:rod shape-determining protein MreC [Rugosibacter aromaticivorans]|uniref:Cell shape-determining protein MreC n=1 Tax=Rugosibacter aromaticivorans TaxID=1565605 RepID=A0A0C5J6K8_9PROT|nr:rod shape-determining protein MreC [Rugosibacter aromaticivorans]AJP47264.1 rod shape-determining protein MreC [Rugosibacter aromaticivorans]TBR16554.1 MAG: rod shape-determining protein MreC [Rugosibacter sp.]